MCSSDLEIFTEDGQRLLCVEFVAVIRAGSLVAAQKLIAVGGVERPVGHDRGADGSPCKQDFYIHIIITLPLHVPVIQTAFPISIAYCTPKTHGKAILSVTFCKPAHFFRRFQKLPNDLRCPRYYINGGVT